MYKRQQKEAVVESREWFDAKAAEVFDRPAHGAAFRIAVSHTDIRPFLQTQDLEPFARSIRDHLERDDAVGKELTADRIRETVMQNFQNFRQGIRRQEAILIKQADRECPVTRIQRKVEKALDSMRDTNSAVSGLLSEINMNHITKTDLGLLGDQFDRAFTALDDTMAEFKRLRQPT